MQMPCSCYVAFTACALAMYALIMHSFLKEHERLREFQEYIARLRRGTPAVPGRHGRHGQVRTLVLRGAEVVDAKAGKAAGKAAGKTTGDGTRLPNLLEHELSQLATANTLAYKTPQYGDGRQLVLYKLQQDDDSVIVYMNV